MGVLANETVGPQCGHSGGLLAEYVTEAVFLHNGRVFLYINPSGMRLLGFAEPGEWMERNITGFLTGLSGQRGNDRSDEEREGGEAAGFSLSSELPADEQGWEEGWLTNVRGEAVPVRSRTMPAPHAAAEVVLVLCRAVNPMDESKLSADNKEQVYESLILHNPAVIVTMDLSGGILSANPAAGLIFGMTEEERTHHRFLDWVVDDSRDFVQSAMGRTLGGQPQNCEFSCRNHAGGRIEMGGKFVPIFIDGEAAGFYFVGKDITSRKLAERELRYTRELLESFVSHTSDAFVVLDRGGIVQQCNAAYITMFGRGEEEVVGQFFPGLTEERFGSFQQLLKRLFASGRAETYDFQSAHKNGMLLDISMTISPIKNARDEIIGLAGVARDITEQRRMEAALRESEAKYRLIADNMTDLVAILDRSGRFRYVSPSHMTMLGIPEGELLGRPLRELVPSDERKRLEKLFARMAATRGPERAEVKVDCPKGRLVMEANWTPILQEDEEIGSYVLAARDITLRTRTEQALREAEAKYRSLVEGALVGVYLIQNWRLTYVNPLLAQMIGYTPEELEGRECFTVIHPDDRQMLQEYRDKMKQGSVHLTLRALHKDGRVVDIEVHGTKTEFQEQTATIGTVMDVTERRRTEELLRKSDKLSVVGQMAAGVAHEIRNPLTSLKGFVQLLKARHSSDRQYLDIMLSELERINYIVSEFMVIAKPQVVHFQQRNAAKILKDVIPILDTQAIMNNVQIKTRMDEERLSLYGDENQLKQVFINVLKNAIEAMPKGGTVYILARRTEGDKILVRFQDQGGGIPEDRMPQIGEPFFTTKEKGTGLGLMVCYKIIEMHGGTIQIRSKLNVGTTVDILLPAVGEAESTPL
ncbi:hypothetical protein J31TS4_05050 [Paenibacillus sp. J31TS4]|uniref:PAS domain S-box protein n=1 Tax=Paenibacillus sp. J31TS4 TaxID=2807195 RepID=UPI001B129C9F|nr:PAS domain S-box protein [Paenibacillus sp. J31TS4]GIP37225.1 hypothetical protein J31TS4_05050 [Paenibacillus sp. J31TS4]